MVFINHMEVLGGKAAIMKIDGPLTSKTSPDFEEYINQLLDKDIIYILLDASGLEFVSSEGIGVMLYIQKKISESNGYFIIYDLNEEVSGLYEILGFDKVFNIAAGKIDALQVMDRQTEMRDEPDIGETDSFSLSLEDDDFTVFENEALFSGRENESSEINRPPVKKDTPAQKIVPFDPFIVECIKCKTLIRVKQSGDYLCPTCNIELTVNSDQTVDFI